MERTILETVKQMIFSDIHEKRYMLAGEAPICNCKLFEDFGIVPAGRAKYHSRLYL
jgi:hypothetical protein